MATKIEVTGVNFVIIRPDGMVLLQKRDNVSGIRYPGKWCFPGGTVEKGEDIFEAAIRELKEETGLEVSESNLEFLLDFSDQPDANSVGRFFLCIIENNIDIVSMEGEMHWKALEDIEKLDFALNHKKLVPRLKSTIKKIAQFYLGFLSKLFELLLLLDKI